MSSKPPPYIPPSPYTPFLRRFTDEIARDLSDTVALYDRVRREHLASVWSRPGALQGLHAYIADNVADVVELPNSADLMAAFDSCQQATLALETVIFTSPEIDWTAKLSLKEQVDLNHFLRAQEYFLANQDRVAERLIMTLGTVFGGLIETLPILPETDDTPLFTAPLISLLPEPADLVDRIIGTICDDELVEAGLFTALQDRFYINVCEASGVVPGEESRKPLLTAAKSTLPPAELVETYLKGTPFCELLLSPLPLSVPEKLRCEHMHVIGGTGHGKTQLLQHLILHDLNRDNPPALIVVDSQGEMLNKIAHLELFADRLSDRLILIDPEDVEHPPALNMFDAGNTRLGTYSKVHQEQIEASVIELYNYVFAAIAAEMTSRQSTAFAFVTRLMLSMPGSTIHTLRSLMEDPAQTLEQSPFADAIEKLDATSRSYFEHQFFSRRYGDLRQQIARRLYGVLSVPSFDRMFSPPVNRLDMFKAMQAGKVVLVNTSKALLKTDASALFGRYMIALTIKAAFERIATSHRPPAFLIVDEAAEYFDDNIETLLSQARKFNLGVVLAHQHLDQLTPALRSSVAANTSIKLAGGVSDRDARSLAADMRTSADFITSMRKRSTSTEFACYLRNTITHALRVEIPFGTLETSPKMRQETYQALLTKNRKRYAARPAPPRPDATSPDKPSPAATPEASAAAEESKDDWRS